MNTPHTFFENASESPEIRSVLLFEKPEFDHESGHVLHQLQQLGIDALEDVQIGKMYLFDGFSDEEVNTIRTELLHEPDHTEVAVSSSMKEGAYVCVAYKPQMTNPELQSLGHAIGRLGIDAAGKKVQTASMYVLHGPISEADRRTAEAYLMNSQVQMSLEKLPQHLGVQSAEESDVVDITPISQLNSKELVALSERMRLFLNEAEMICVQNHFKQKRREPTDGELETIAQTWSEHCGHKTFKAKIVINGVEKDPLMKRLKDSTARINHPDVISCFSDNAGVVRFNSTHGVAVKIETHNAPTALDPFGGADTGLGGVIRDCLGTGQGGMPVAACDVLLFGDPDTPDNEVPPGCLHPSRIMRGAVAGIRNYGNKFGIPNISGAVFFDKRFGPKPGLLAGCVAMIPLDKAEKGKAQSGDHLLCIGGKTGKDGIHGATFSSAGMTAETATLDSASVQIGYPVLEREISFVIQILRDEGIIHAITDCGAGGISSAITEMAEDLGADVQLKNLSMKFKGLLPWQKWISESQERMVLAIASDRIDEAIEICRHYGINADDLGICRNGDKQIIVKHGDKTVVNMDLDFLLKGNPIKEITGTYEKPEPKLAAMPVLKGEQLESLLTSVLGDLNVCSREGIVRGYDHTVTGMPMNAHYDGKHQDAPQDSIIMRPHSGEDRGFSMTHGLAPEMGDLDPYAAAQTSFIEAVSNAVSRGANPEKIFMIDNYLHPTPDNPIDVGTLDRTTDGLVDAADAFGMPFVSGKDSLGMRFKSGDLVIKAPPTVVVSALSIFETLEHTVPSHFCEIGTEIVLVGEADLQELGGSVAARHLKLETDAAPSYDLAQQKKIFNGVHRAIRDGDVLSCHDVRQGGIFTTLAEMSFGNDIAAHIKVPGIDENIVGTLLSEKAGRFIVELPPGTNPFKLFRDLPFVVIGETIEGNQMELLLPQGESITFAIDQLREANHNPALEDVFPVDREENLEWLKPKMPFIRPKLRSIPKGGQPRALVLRAPGTNSDAELRTSLELAGAMADIVHLADLTRDHFKKTQILAIPGGFSYGDDIFSGTIFAADLVKGFGDDLREFLQRDTLGINICNGHQVALRSGLLPFKDVGERQANSLFNANGRFVCRRVTLLIEDSVCKWTQTLKGQHLVVPVAHAEGRFHTTDETLVQMEKDKQIVARYADPSHKPTQKAPYNPNGSRNAVAGITTPDGKLLSLMPHPERDWHNYSPKRDAIKQVIGLDILRGGVDYFQ